MGDEKSVPRRPGGSPGPLTPIIHVSTIKARFEWDESKAQSNTRKHGVTFEQGTTVFDDPHRRYERDPAHSTVLEVRERIVGSSDVGILVVVFTRRDGGRTRRIISARRASRRERTAYKAKASAE